MKNKLYLYVKAFSDLGSRMDTIVLGALIYAATQSVAWLSASMAAGVIGGLLSGFVSGVVADRFDRKKIMIVTDWLRCGLILLLIPFPQPEMILLVRFLMGLVGSFFEVSYNAEVPQIYGDQNLLNVNALISRLGAVSMVIGFLAGGVLQDQLGYQAVLVIDSLSFLLSAIALQRMKWDHARAAPPEANDAGSDTAAIPPKSTVRTVLRQQWGDLKEVAAFLKTQSALLIVFMVFLADTFGAGSHNLGAPLLAEKLDPNRQALFYGLIWATWGAGNVLSTFIMPKIAWFRRHPGRIYLLATPFMSLGFIGMFATEQVEWVLPASFATGIADAIAMTTLMTVFQQTENRIRGRIFGVSAVLNRLGFGLGFIAAPLIMEKLNLFEMVVTLHGFVIAAALIGILLYRTTTVTAVRREAHGQIDPVDETAVGG